MVFLKNVFGLEGAIEKCVGCFLLYLLFGFFLLKTAVCVIILKNALLPHFYVHLWLGRVYAKRGSWAAAKHTTNMLNLLFPALRRL